MSNSVSANLVGITGNGQCLEYALRTHRDGIAVVAQHIAEHHVFERLFVVLLRHIERNILGGTQLIGILFVGLQLLSAETTRVGTRGIYLVAFLFCQIHHCVAGI